MSYLNVYNVQKDFSMSNMRIRNMFLLVTALAVMFLLACGETVAEDSADELAMYTFANCDELAQVFLAGGGIFPSGTTSGLTRIVVGSIRTVSYTHLTLQTKRIV